MRSPALPQAPAARASRASAAAYLAARASRDPAAASAAMCARFAAVDARRLADAGKLWGATRAMHRAITAAKRAGADPR